MSHIDTPSYLSEPGDLATLEVALIENVARERLNPVEDARACSTLAKEFGLTYRQIEQRVGRSRSVIANLIRLLDLPGEVLGLVERGELGSSHGRALLVARDPWVRWELARRAVQEQLSVTAIEARARASNAELVSPGDAPSGKGHGDLDRPVLAAAEAWGEVLGVEVGLRPMRSGRVRLEVEFSTPAAALALATRLGNGRSNDHR
jgi:ParB family chromosome partitioning protein